MMVTDASPLIVLARIRRLALLKALYGKVLVGPIVKRETIDSGRATRAAGVEQIEAAVTDGWLCVEDLTSEEEVLDERILRRSGLDRGESESLALATARGLRLIVDDKQARNVAEASGVEYLGTMGMLLQACLRGCLDLQELENAIRDASQISWISASVVVEVLRLAREAKK